MREIELTQGYKAIVDDEDFEALSQWHWCLAIKKLKGGKLYPKVYRAYSENGKQKRIGMARQLMSTPKGFVCDHINGNSLDNRRQNLRNCTIGENNHNQTRLHGNNISGFKGVFRRTKAKKWNAAIKVDGKIEHLGTFANKTEAAIAYNNAALRLHGEFASLNQNI